MVVDPTKGKDVDKLVSSIGMLQVKMSKLHKESKSLTHEIAQNGQVMKVTSTTVDKAGNKYKKTEHEVTNLSKAMNGLRWTMVNTIFVMAGIAAVVSPFVKLTKDAMAFEHQLARISAITGSVSSEIKEVITSTREGTPLQ